MTIQYTIGYFLLVILLGNCASISSRFEILDSSLCTYYGLKFDLLGSRDVIGHVTMRLAIGGPLEPSLYL